MTAATVSPPAGASTGGLSGTSRKMGAPYRTALVLGSAVLTLLLFWLTPLQGRVDFVVVAVLIYAVAQTALSFATEGLRFALDRLMTLFVYLAMLAALFPLFAVLVYTIDKGVKALNWTFLTTNLSGIGPLSDSGGESHAIIGTLEQVGLMIVLATPLGLLVAIYLTEYGKGALAAGIRFVVDVMTGIPSIVAGLFIFAFLVIALKQGYSGFAASLALTILMFPVVVRSAEEMIKLVPGELREASYALGIPKWKTILRVVLPAASAGITTGVMLGIARITGETAPLLLTSFVQPTTNKNAFAGKQTAIPTFIFDQAGQGQDITYARAWAAALTLIIIVLVLYVVARLITRRNALSRR